MIAMFIDTGSSEGSNVPFIIETGKQYLLISTMFYFFLGLIFVFRNTIQGMGKPILPLLSSITELVTRAFAAIYLAQLLGYEGIMYASPISWVAAGLLVVGGYLYYIHKFSQDGLRWQMGQIKQQLRENGPED